MQIHEIKRENKNKTKKRVGRGGIRGDYSGRGNKGQGQHASSAPRPEIRDMIKKIPKKRGYRFNSIQKDFYVVNVSALNELYKDGEQVTPQSLDTKELVRIKKGETRRIKILGTGDLSKKLTVKDCLVSGSAKEKIEKAGGSVTPPKEKVITKAPGKAPKAPKTSK